MLLDDFIVQVSCERAKIIEERLRLHIRPKHKLIPSFIWVWFVKKFLYLEEGGTV